jgi:hypothetical protein
MVLLERIEFLFKYYISITYGLFCNHVTASKTDQVT